MKTKSNFLPQGLKQDKIKFIIQTFKRDKTGYDYLKQTVSGIIQNFKHYPLPFEIFAYTSSKDCHVEGATCHTIKRDSKMLEIQDKLIKKSDKRGQRISGQTMDFYSLLTAVQTDCTKNEIFFFMEDDFLFCNHSALHWQLVKNWGLDHYDFWRSIRVSIGLNGLFLKCEDIPYYLNIIDEAYKKDPSFPIDNTLGYKWTHHYSHEEKVQYVYRYNLLSHIGDESSVTNKDGRRSNKCLQMNRNSDFLWFEHYNYVSCPGYLFSPCDNKMLFKNYELGMNPHQELTISSYATDKLLEQNLIEIKFSKEDGIDCNQVCSSHKMRCFQQGFLMINSGRYLRDRWYGKSIWVINDNTDPTYQYPYHILWTARTVKTSNCENRHPGFHRICPCTKNSTLHK